MRSYVRSSLSALALTLFGLQAQANELVVDQEDLVQIRPGLWAALGLKLPEPDLELPVTGPDNTQDGVRLLRLQDAQGDINGFAGVIYDNRDRGHSLLNPSLYPSLTHLKYGPALAAAGLDYGLAGRTLVPAVVLGNSSTAMSRGPTPRSLPRLAMTAPPWNAITATLYANNHIYVYPEHKDYDSDDRFPANWPYMVVSQGSSGSDQRFLNAIALTLAALPEDTFEFLRENRLVAPTVQMILRRNLSTISSRADYLSGRAHPVAFDGRLVQSGRMVAQASRLSAEDVPPLVKLRILEESFSDAAGLADLGERFLNTPAAIGRLWRSFAWEREMVITAEDTEAPNDRPLTYEWRLLRGDPERVRIEPQGTDGATARISIAWHDPWMEPIPRNKKGKERRFSRVDIGVFANNSVHDSAPAIISIDFPEHQIREYSTDATGKRRLVSIDYDAKRRKAYFDPLLYWSAPWKDTARYEENGTLLGWDRQDSQGTTVFVSNETDGTGPSYEIEERETRTPVLRQVGG